MQNARLLDARHASWRKPFLVIGLAEDILHEVRLRNTAVVGWIADGRDVLGCCHLGRELDRHRKLWIAAGYLDLKERKVGSGLLLDMQRLDQLEDERGRIVDF